MVSAASPRLTSDLTPRKVVVGVLADTHVPDRVSEIHPLILPTFRAAGVSHILHAGDICSRGVLEQLRQIAPVTAVSGNRDWLLPGLPLARLVTLGGVKVGLMHGHGGLRKYLVDKVLFTLVGYNVHRYLRLLSTTLPEAQVVVYGHTHHPEILWYRGKLLFNPGSASFGMRSHSAPAVGLLHLCPDCLPRAEMIFLEDYHVKGRQWVKTPSG